MFEGSYIKGTEFKYLAEGAYGVVFFDRNSKRVRKVAYRKSGVGEIHCRTVSENEIHALETAQNSPKLKPFIASPIRRVVMDQILDSNGLDITERFYGDAAFEADFIKGTFHKIGSINASNKVELVQQFKLAGICHIVDASVTLNGDTIGKVIDFAMKEEELFW